MTRARHVAWLAMTALSLMTMAPEAWGQRRGVRLEFGSFVVQPLLDDRSGELFERIGKFRPGLGTSMAIGYDTHGFGATATLELAGLDIGAPRTRNGIDMGRESGIFRSAGFLAHWSPNSRPLLWQPLLTAVYVKQ